MLQEKPTTLRILLYNLGILKQIKSGKYFLRVWKKQLYNLSFIPASMMSVVRTALAEQALMVRTDKLVTTFHIRIPIHISFC